MQERCSVGEEKSDVILGAVQTGSKNFQESPNERNEQHLNRHWVNLYATYNQEKQNMISKQITELEEATVQNKWRLTWETVREISRSKSSQSIKVVGKTPQDQLLNWEAHFKELLGKLPLPSDYPTHTIISKQLSIKTGDFTLAELLASIKSMSNHKSCGLDEIDAEPWKTGQLINVLLLVWNKALKGDVPTP